MMNRVPLIVVLGATGSGKSKLAIELALKYNGEIISADSMQVYKKLDIITNKVTQEERALVPHHIIDFLSPLERYSVVEFRNHALRTIDEIIKRKRIPVIVGGTNYYIEAILWKILVDTHDVTAFSESPSGNSISTPVNDLRPDEILPERTLSTESVHSCSGITSGPKVPYQDSPFVIKKAELLADQEKIRSKMVYVQSIFQFLQDSLRAPVSKLFECIDPVYRIKPDVPPEELRDYPRYIYNKIFGQTDAIENIKRHKASIQLMMQIVDEIYSLIFGLQKVLLLVKGHEDSETEPRTYLKNCLVPNLMFLNVSALKGFMLALFPDMVRVRTELDALFEEINSVFSDCVTNSAQILLVSESEFLSQLDKTVKVSCDKMDILIGELKQVVMLEEDRMDHLSGQELHARLSAADPNRAAELHPNDRRKVFRSLQVFLKTGKKHSLLLKDQKSEPGSSKRGGPLRFPNTCVLWLQTDQAVLDSRLDSRVDEMIERGLIQELSDFHKEYNVQRLVSKETAEYTKGIFQSIGFKEFHNYLILSEEEQQSEKGRKLLQEGIDSLKQATRRYSRAQIKWIKNRFFRTVDRCVPPVYGIDSTNVDDWNEKVKNPSLEIISHLVEGGIDALTKCSIQPIPKEIDYPQQESHKDFYCEVCQRLFIGTLQWEQHLKSKKHAKVLSKKKKKEALQEPPTETQ